MAHKPDLGDARPFITVDDLVLRPFGTASPPIRWQILDDQHWAVVGPNGAGKSTLVRAVGGRVAVARGRVVYHFAGNGTAPGMRPEDQIAYVDFQGQRAFVGGESAYHQSRWNSLSRDETPTVAEYLAQSQARRISPFQVMEAGDGRPAADALLASRQQAVELLGIEALLDRRLAQVSSGERRKVLIARALLQKPRLLILDNPFAGLDSNFRVKLRDIVAGLMAGSMRLVVVATSWDDLPPGITHVLAMDGSRVVAQGPHSRNAVILNGAPPDAVILNGTPPDAVILNGAPPDAVILNGAPPDAVTWNGTQRNAVILNGAQRSEESPVRQSEILRFAQDDGDARADAQNDRGAEAGGQDDGDGGGTPPVLVRMEDVSVAYDGVQVLAHVDWTVRQGERWALLGPNGAGKTTLLSLILGDNPQAYANRVTLFGRRRGSGESIWEIKERVGWVAPELHLYYPRGLTCLDVVCSGFFDSVGLYRRCSRQQRQTALAWMEQLGSAPIAGRPFDAISEGQQRLVLMARAVVKEPALLLLDEPCQGLDAQHRDRVLQTVETIGRRLEASMVYVTHDARALPPSITYLLRLDGGRVVARGRLAAQLSPSF
jgi:ABC-type molybdenum transport system ATPase subunit/photorepair protein PhrA